MKEKFLKALEDKDFSELFKKGGISLFLRIGGQVMGFLMSFVVAHYFGAKGLGNYVCLLYTSPSPRDRQKSRMPSSA